MASMNNILAVDVLNPGEVAIQIAASVKSQRAKLDLSCPEIALQRKRKLNKKRVKLW